MTNMCFSRTQFAKPRRPSSQVSPVHRPLFNICNKAPNSRTMSCVRGSKDHTNSTTKQPGRWPTTTPRTVWRPKTNVLFTILYTVISPYFDHVSVISVTHGYILEQISNATLFNFKYFSSGINYQAYSSYVSAWGYEVSFRRKEILNSCHVTNSDEIRWNYVIWICSLGFMYFSNILP